MQVADAIIFTSNQELKLQLVEILKMKKVINIVQAEDAKTALDSAQRFAKGLLIIDWAVGSEDAVKVLAPQSKIPEATERAIMVITSELTEDIVATATEYGVGYIYSEALERKNLSAKIGALLLDNSQSAPYKKTLAKVKKLRKQGKWAETIEPLRTLLQKDSKDWHAKAELASTFLELGHVDEATQVLGGVQNTKPPFLRGIHILGRAEMMSGNFDRALQILQTANSYNSQDPDRLVEIGHALLELQRADEAEEYFDAAIDLDPDMRQATIGKGKCLLVQDKVNEALALLKGTTSKRELASIFNMSAVMTMRGGNHEAGMKLYLAAIKALGSNQQIHARLLFNMGIGFRRWKQPEKAINAFQKSLQLDPSYGKAKDQISNLMAAPQAAAPTDEPTEEAPPVENLSAPEETLEIPKPDTTGTGLLDFDSDFDDIDLEDDDLEEGIEYR